MNSAFSLATSTLEGHSDLQPLQLRQRSITSYISRRSYLLALSDLVKNSRRIFARALVVSFSLRVAINEGHIVPPANSVLRQSPEPFHCSACWRISWS